MIFGTLTRFKAEATLIGKILTTYSELEIGLLHCVNVLKEDFDGVFTSMYKKRGESARLKEAVKIGKPLYAAIKLDGEFDAGITAMNYCREIRNQYAHAVWWDDYSEQLAFANPEDLIKPGHKVENLVSLVPRHVSAELLQEQEKYFHHAGWLLTWVNFEGQLRRNKIKENGHMKPTPLKKPNMHLP